MDPQGLLTRIRAPHHRAGEDVRLVGVDTLITLKPDQVVDVELRNGSHFLILACLLEGGPYAAWNSPDFH